MGPMGLMGVLDFSTVSFDRCVSFCHPFWTPVYLILDTRLPHFGHPSTSFWTPVLYNFFMGPIGLIGHMGVLNFSPVRSVRCSPPFWTPVRITLRGIREPLSIMVFTFNFSRFSRFSRFSLPRSGLNSLFTN